MMENKSDIPPLPYLNSEFLKSPAARAIRILSEYLEPADRLRRAHIRDTIVFFGSARSPSPDQAKEQGAQLSEPMLKLAGYYQNAVDLSRRLTEWSMSLTGHYDFVICSGGSGGMMEAANRGAALAGGKSLGLNIELPREQSVNSFVPHELVFDFHYFFMRKFWFVYLAKALVVFPGGFGTMDEFFEVLTLIQTRKPRKTMPVVLFGGEYWDEVIDFNAFVRWGTISPEELQIFYKTDSVDDAFNHITARLEALYLTPEGLDQIKLT
jgi:uncharacterized protein (TIGR00730 family)